MICCGKWPSIILYCKSRTGWHGCAGCLQLQVSFRKRATNYSDLYCKSRTGWHGCAGCLQLQVSFRKRATNYSDLLRKVTYKDKASYASSPPCRKPYLYLSFSAKEPYNQWLFCGKWLPEIWHYVHLRHSVASWMTERCSVIFCKRATNYGTLLRKIMSFSAKEPLIMKLFCGK